MDVPEPKDITKYKIALKIFLIFKVAGGSYVTQLATWNIPNEYIIKLTMHRHFFARHLIFLFYTNIFGNIPFFCKKLLLCEFRFQWLFKATQNLLHKIFNKKITICIPNKDDNNHINEALNRDKTLTIVK